MSGRAMLTAALLCLLGGEALAARPAPRARPASLEDRDVGRDVTWVLAEFEGTRAQAQAVVDGLLPRQGISPGTVTVGFVPARRKLLALAVTGNRRLGSLLGLAQALSQEPGVTRSFLTLHPGADDATGSAPLELEGYWECVRGRAVRSVRTSWREDKGYLAWLRRKTTDAELGDRQATWALARLSTELGIPGRWFLSHSGELFWLAQERWPHDVGPELVRLAVWLPEELSVEAKQSSELSGRSFSRTVQDALEAAPREASDPAWGDFGEELAEAGAAHETVLYLSRPVAFRLWALADERDESDARVVMAAWRFAHPGDNRSSKR